MAKVEAGQMSTNPRDIAELDLMWLVGYLEGEGCFTFAGGHCPSIRVKATDEDVIRRAAHLMGAKTVSLKPSSSPKWKDCYAFSVCGDCAIDWMKALLPFMGQRRQDRIREVLSVAEKRSGIPRGEQRANARLRNEDVAEIFRQAQDGVPQVELARKWNVKPSYVADIITRRTWRTVTNSLIAASVPQEAAVL